MSVVLLKEEFEPEAVGISFLGRDVWGSSCDFSAEGGVMECCGCGTESEDLRNFL